MKLFHEFGLSIAVCILLKRSEIDEINCRIVSLLSMNMDSTGTPQCNKQNDSFKIKQKKNDWHAHHHHHQHTIIKRHWSCHVGLQEILKWIHSWPHSTSHPRIRQSDLVLYHHQKSSWMTCSQRLNIGSQRISEKLAVISPSFATFPSKFGGFRVPGEPVAFTNLPQLTLAPSRKKKRLISPHSKKKKLSHNHVVFGSKHVTSASHPLAKILL